MFQYSLIKHDENTYLTVYITGHQPMVADSSHPNWNALVEGAIDSDESIVDLFDVSVAAARKFDRISDRVTTANGHIFFDGDHVDNALTKQIIRFLDEGVEDWLPLVHFFEKVRQNPNPQSVEQLYDWLNALDFTITQDGNIVGYKGVKALIGEDKEFRSTSSGQATVNDEVQTGYIRQSVGDTVEMPRGAVAHNPAAACSTGLHVGTHHYAAGYGDTLLEVHVDPRDVVSVPTEAGGNKIRVCRYVIVGTLDKNAGAYQEPVLIPDEPSNPHDSAPWANDPVEDDPVAYGLAQPPPPADDEDIHTFGRRVPTEDEFNHMRSRAKKRRRNFVKYATKHGPWQIHPGDDPNERTNWIVQD